MPDTTCHMSISLDGFVAGPDQSRENPLGKRGGELHGWHLGDARANDADKRATAWLMRPRGAYIMGRNMFGPIRGDWDADWRGWWGPEPPYHAPVFVLTHHAHEPVEMEGGTTFYFVTEGFDVAMTQARETAATTVLTSRAVLRLCARRWRSVRSTSSRSTLYPSCSGRVSRCSMVSRPLGSSPTRCSILHWRRTSATAELGKPDQRD